MGRLQQNRLLLCEVTLLGQAFGCEFCVVGPCPLALVGAVTSRNFREAQESSLESPSQ